MLKNMETKDWHSLLIYATRYAINRHTYASSDMADIVIKNAAYIPMNTRAILIRDIEEEMERDAISRTDLPNWQSALKALKETLLGQE